MHIFTKYDKGNTFVVLVLVWTWLILGVPALLGYHYDDLGIKIAYLLAGASPSLFGLFFVFQTKNSKYRKTFIRRIFSLGNANGKMIGFVLVFVPSVTFVAALINRVISGEPFDFSVIGEHFQNIPGLLVFILFSIIFGPLAEEIGWRGYLSDQWKNKGILFYGLGIGFIWTIWHLPMFLIVGTYQNSLLAQGVLAVSCFVISTISYGVLLGHLAVLSNSILLAIIFHFSINFVGEILPLSITGEAVRTCLLLCLACGVVYYVRKSYESISEKIRGEKSDEI
jgi:membrane protease YdiL (CAAX protease family)